MTADDLGAVSIRKTVLPGMAIPMLKIRHPNGRLIFNMEIAIRILRRGPGSLRRQGISRHNIELVLPQYSSFIITRVKHASAQLIYWFHFAYHS